MIKESYAFEKVAQALQILSQEWSSQPSLDEVAARVHVSPFHFQKMFTEWAGVSPKKFIQYLTVSYAKERLIAHKDSSLLETAQAAGLSSASRLHDLFINIEGMTPGEYQNRGAFLNIKYSLQAGPFGKYIIASTEKGICQLNFFDGEKHAVVNELRSKWSQAIMVEAQDGHHEAVMKFFERDFSAPAKIKLHLRGTDFQLKVWEALLKIPQGNLTSYGEVASEIQNPLASRAVGTAIGHNPVAFLIPCHRVIRQAGDIGQFRWGTIRKKAMIGWEASRVQRTHE